MRKRGRRNEPEDDDLSFLDTLDDGGDVVVDDLPDAPDEPAREARRGGMRLGGCLSGLVSVVLMALIALVSSLIVGFSVVYGAQMLGLLPGEAPSLSIAPPAILAPSPSATPVGVEPAAAITPEACPELIEWWDQRAETFSRFLSVSPQTTPAADLPALLRRLEIGRDSSASLPTPDCAAGAQSALLAGIDAIIGAVETQINGLGNPGGQMKMAYDAFSDLLPTLWRAGIAAGNSSPVAQGVAIGSGSACGASAWNDLALDQRRAFENAFTQIDLDTMPPPAIRQNLNAMAAARGNVDTLNAPDCAVEPKRLLLESMDGALAYIEGRLGGDAAAGEALVQSYRAAMLYEAWMQALGLNPG
jgi:hypothetical protein